MAGTKIERSDDMSYSSGNTNKKDKNLNKRPSAFNMYMHPYRHRFLRWLRRFVGTLLALFLVFMALSGAINQVKTGESIIDHTLGVSKKIGNFLESLFKNDSPLKITEDGIYFKDADVPDESALDGVLPNQSSEILNED